MDTEQFKRDLIEQMRDEKARQGMSCQAICDRTEVLGTAISFSTVSKVFAPSASARSFKLSTLLAIAQALGIEPLEDDGPDEMEAVIRLEEAQKAIKSKDEQIASMRTTINTLEQQVSALMAGTNKKERRIVILTVALCSILLAATLLLGFDILQPNVGYFK